MNKKAKSGQFSIVYFEKEEISPNKCTNEEILEIYNDFYLDAKRALGSIEGIAK